MSNIEVKFRNIYKVLEIDNPPEQSNLRLTKMLYFCSQSLKILK